MCWLGLTPTPYAPSHNFPEKQHLLQVKDFPVEFQDVQIHQAVVVTDGQKVNLGVQITPNNRFFVSRPPLLACAYLRISKALPIDIMRIALSRTMGSSFECQPVRSLQCLTASQA